MSYNNDFSENALKVLEKRYLIKDDNGNCVETPLNMLKRVAKAVSLNNEADEKRFFEIMKNHYFMPNSPTLMNAGKELGQLSACFVLPIEDSLESIFETLKNTALIHQSGGGTGFSFSRLRPKNSLVRSTKGVSSGPISFMEVYNSATEAVKQGGTRRGANMGILRVDHPDIVDFINCKTDLSKLNNFNISVAITDDFMKAYFAGEDYDLISPQTAESCGRKNAKEVFDLIVERAWQSGEPGIIFIDKMNADNPTPNVAQIESTNPCGEVPLLPYEACNLGSINLAKMVTDSNEIDWKLLESTVRISIRFLDNVITANKFPLPQIEEMVLANRKIGLGIMGWADMLMKLGISYSSDKAVTFATQIMEFIQYISKTESVDLAKERGRFKNFEGSVYDCDSYFYNKYHGGFITDEQWQKLDEDVKKYGLRNATTTCIAPTGTISMIAGASGGIEPLFGLVFLRNIMDGTELLEVNPIFEEYMKSNGLYSQNIMEEIAKSGSVAHISSIPQGVKEIFQTAHDITPYWHVKMQASFQKYTDNAVSKTVNFVESATKEDIQETYILAYKNNLKGITVYRNNSRKFQPMNLEVKEETYNPTGEIKTVKCPECGTEIQMAEGCFICLNCGYSGCA